MNFKDIEQEIIAVLSDSKGKAMNYKQIYAKGGFDLEISAKDLIPVLENMLNAKTIASPEHGRYAIPVKPLVYTGIIDITRSGVGYLPNDDGEDILIEPEDTLNALHGDTVEVTVSKGFTRKQMRGRVSRIVQRSKSVYTGILEIQGKYAFVIADDKRLPNDIYIPTGELPKGVKSGLKVAAEITSWAPGAKNPGGRIVSVLGVAGENDTEMNAIVMEFGFPSDFSDAVKAEASRFGNTVKASDINGREDFRDVLTFTIDPETAKDFDDALSFQVLPNGNIQVGVHIADVSHYVVPGTAIDQEAYLRATSVYLVDRVIPMLPHNLSDNLCSLVPHEDRLTFAAIFEFDRNFQITHHHFAKTVIHSDIRFSYEQAQEVLENKAPFPNVKGAGPDVLHILNDIAKHLNKIRFEHGSIVFESVEYRFVLDEDGKPLGLTVKERKDAHKLIEEFMLLANKKVAEFVHGDKQYKGPRRPFIYRTHDAPAEPKLLELKNYAAKWGYRIQIDNDNVIRRSLNELSAAIEGKPEQGILQQMSIRSMAKAIYTHDKPGHFGLAFNYYSHFTSPIRRYPDLIAHRLLYAYLHNQTMKEAIGWTENQLADACKQCSMMEQKASDAERASIKYKQAEFIQDHVGEQFEGIISGVTDWGIYVELIENRCEGMVRLNSLRDDQYEYDSVNKQAVGRFSFRKYKLGDSVMVIVKAASPINRTIDFTMVESGTKYARQGRSKVRDGFRMQPKSKSKSSGPKPKPKPKKRK